MKIGNYSYTLVTPKTFYEKFNKPLFVVNKNKQLANSPMEIVSSTVNLRFKNNLGHDVYFIPNNGGTKIDDINRINCCFIDLDAGKNANGTYKSDVQVNKAKVDMRLCIEKCPVKPNYIVETRNGYQLYWMLNEQDNVYNSGTYFLDYVQRWKLVQNKLCRYFSKVGADSKVLKLNQIMRAPGYKWCKSYTRLKPFSVQVYKRTGGNYQLATIANSLSNVSAAPLRSNANSYRKQQVPLTYVTGNIKQSSDLGSWQVNVQHVPSTSLLTEVVDYLGAVQKILHYSGNQFLSKQAVRLQHDLQNHITQGQ